MLFVYVYNYTCMFALVYMFVHLYACEYNAYLHKYICMAGHLEVYSTI